jgi:hypothetical protein
VPIEIRMVFDTAKTPQRVPQVPDRRSGASALRVVALASPNRMVK